MHYRGNYQHAADPNMWRRGANWGGEYPLESAELGMWGLRDGGCR